MKKWIQVKKNWSPEQKEGRSPWGTVLLSFLLPGILAGVAVWLVVRNQGNLEAGISTLGNLLPFGYAFAAGMVASVNPCGVMMLTSYTFQQIKRKEEQGSVRVGWGVLTQTLAISLIFLLLFLGIGTLISLGVQWVVGIFPLVGLLIGVLMTGLGVWLLASGQTLSLDIGNKEQVNRSGSLKGAIAFGFSYALASLSCTLPIFLVVVGSALGGDTGFLGGLGQFGAYALGMGFVVLIFFLGAALFRRTLARWLRKVTPFVHRLSSLFLVGAGLYLVYYWVTSGLL